MSDETFLKQDMPQLAEDYIANREAGLDDAEAWQAAWQAHLFRFSKWANLEPGARKAIAEKYGANVSPLFRKPRDK